VGIGQGDFKFEIQSKAEVRGMKSKANMYRNETVLDKGGLAAARVVLLWS
jgi:hypothetical protein